MLGLTGFDRRWVGAQDALLWDDTGREYIDCIAGYAVHGTD
jgi:acetylornithine/succinyldiaminopimelate/putrescine aminotransferase